MRERGGEEGRKARGGRPGEEAKERKGRGRK